MKTYLPKLLKILEIVCKYILRYNVQIKKNLPSNAAPAVDAVVTACQALSVIVDAAIPDPS